MSLDDERIQAASDLRVASMVAAQRSLYDEKVNWHKGDWMLTFTGKHFYPLSPREQDIELLDIAHALGMLCRYNGHVDRFYSVAEHCCLMSDTFPDDEELARWALLHDGTEAYVGDMVRPLKLNLPDYRYVEDEVMRVIARRFSLGLTDFPATADLAKMPKVVKDADTRILLTERNALMSNYAPSDRWFNEDMAPLDVTIFGWSPEEATMQYLARAERLGIK